MIKHINILYFTALLLLMGCDVNDTRSIAANSIVYCSEGAPEVFNPQTVTSGVTIDATSKQLYNRLINFSGDDGSIAPAIAKSWHVTRDGKKITFYLRKDVSFHSTAYFTPTRNLNADDVLFSFNRILDKSHPYHSVNGARYPFFQSVEFSSLVQEIEKINEHTIRFILNRAESSLLANLATDFAVILSAEYAQQLAEIGEQSNIDYYPVGTGPYKYKDYRSGSFIRYLAHPTYWETPVPIKQLVFDITPKNTGRLTKLLAGECDISSYPIAHHKIVENPNLRLDEITAFNVGYLGFNTLKAPFNDARVRKAIALAINKKAILDTVYFGRAEIANTILPKTSWAYNPNSPEQVYSIVQAKKLLIEAGYTNGFTMDIWAMPVQRAYNPDALTMAKLIQSDLSEIGVIVNIVSYEWSVFLRRLAKGEHQSVLLGWSADHPDPDNFFTPLLSCASATTGNNRTFWCNEAFEQLIQKALQTTNINRRKNLYIEALNIVEQETPLVPIAHSKRYQARNKAVNGQLLHAFGGISFKEVSKN